MAFALVGRLGKEWWVRASAQRIIDRIDQYYLLSGEQVTLRPKFWGVGRLFGMMGMDGWEMSGIYQLAVKIYQRKNYLNRMSGRPPLGKSFLENPWVI